MLKNRFMSVMPLGPTMHAKWDPASLGPPQMHPYKVDRPAYSTPPPVENTPANNECRMVELRGSQIASFSIGHEEYICLPQAFDLFLKHLVGGLHTVYTKLKRLSIAPVVCNVEQVRILRGLGAIQPGVNRCKLITRKDFEILYQDCTTASRPGRPPKRYPMLPPTADLMSHHANMRANNSSLLNTTDLSSLHKRLRLDHNLDSQHIDQTANGSPTIESEKLCANPNEFHSNQSTNLAYLQQAIRQYQQVSMSGLHNGMDSSQINSALAPYLMMSHPSLFAGIPPTSMAMFNHINQIAQSHTGGISSAAVAAQLAASGSPIHQQSMQRENSQFGMGDKDSDNDDMEQPRSTVVRNSVGSDERTSPASSMGSIQDGGSNSFSDNRNRNNSFEYQAKNSPIRMKIGSNDIPDAVRDLTKIEEYTQVASASEEDDKSQIAIGGNMSSLQTLLTNIQGLLKVVADNVSLQEKHSSIEIADLKLKLNKEKQLRENTQRKMEECEKGKADVEKFLMKEKRENQKLQTKVVSMQQLLNQGDAALSPPLRSPQPSPAENSTSEVQLQSANPPTPPGSISSPINSYAVASTYEPSVFTARIAAAVQQVSSHRNSPPVSPEGHSSTNQISNENNSNNHEHNNEYVRRNMLREGRAPDIAIDLALSRQQEQTALQDAHLYFKNSLLFQPAASQ